MRKLCFSPVLPLIIIFTACATEKALVFIEARDMNTTGSILVNNIDDFENLIKKNKVDTVFYTDEYFVAQINSMLYSHISRGYRNFNEYREGKLEKPERWSIFTPGYSD
jgi:hypothetical protein